MTQTQIIAIVAFIYATLPILCALASLQAAHYYERQARSRMALREADVLAREIELGRRAHDINTSISLYASRIENDTTLVSVLDWANPEVPRLMRELNRELYEFHYRAYYGPGGRQGGKGRPGELEGDFACGLDTNNEGQRNLEADLAEAREDIGKVERWNILQPAVPPV